MATNKSIESKIERALRPRLNEEFTVKATIEDEDGKDFIVKFKGSVDDCNDWLTNISRVFSVLRYDAVFEKAKIDME